MVCFIWLKVPKVNSVCLMATSKSINSSSFGSTLLQVLMVLVAMSMLCLNVGRLFAGGSKNFERWWMATIVATNLLPLVANTNHKLKLFTCPFKHQRWLNRDLSCKSIGMWLTACLNFFWKCDELWGSHLSHSNRCGLYSALEKVLNPALVEMWRIIDRWSVFSKI